MNAPAAAATCRWLIYEPQLQGHHLSWLRYITEDLLSANFDLSLAVDFRRATRDRMQAELGNLLPRVNLVSAYDEAGRLRGGGHVEAVAECQKEAGAQRVFLCCFDEIASACARRAAVGRMPPATLRGVTGGIYLRPRFLAAGHWTPNRWLKARGFQRCLRDGWFRPLFLLDEYLCRALLEKDPTAPYHFLPDTCPEFLGPPADEARRALGVPEAHRVFLFYGGPYRRKGLHLAVAAMEALPAGIAAFLLCAGQQPADPPTAATLARLVQAGRACVVDRYISAAEEALCFAACDVVLLPYVRHFGSSGVLTRAAAAGKPVIASDEELVGRRVRDHELGWVFPSGNVAALCACLQNAVALPEAQRQRWSDAAMNYAARCTRQKFRTALLSALPSP